MPHSPGRARRGMSLIETTMAIAVLAFGLGATLQLYSSSIRTAKLSRERLVAERIAQRKAAELKAAGYAAIDTALRLANSAESASDTIQHPLDLSEAERSLLPLPVRWRAEVVREEAPARCLRIVSIVEWGAYGKESRIESETAVFP